MAGETARQSRTAEQIEQFEMNVGKLAEVVCKLEEHLSQVLSPGEPAGPSNEALEDLSAYATRLRCANMSLEGTIASIVDITSRLEV